MNTEQTSKNIFMYILKEDYQKALKNVNFIFLSIPLPFNGLNYEKGPGTSD